MDLGRVAAERQGKMNAVGIVSEYNPFHFGHLFHLEKIRKIEGEDTLILCALSGDFVQRGEPAVFSKYARAEMAVRCGADLVAELPAIWSLQSAEGFSEAAVSILYRMGATALSCGVESVEEQEAEAIASLLLSSEFERKMKERILAAPEEAYAFVREETLRSYIGERTDILRNPNDILALEYRKSILKHSYPMRFLPVKRTGSAHDSISEGTVRSAFDIRNMLSGGKDISRFLPEESCRIMKRETEALRGPVFLNNLEQALLARLRSMTAEDVLQCGDCSRELSERIIAAVHAQPYPEEVFLAAKNRKYSLSRVRRVCFCAALGIKSQMQKTQPPYIRILAANEKGCQWLKERKKTAPGLPFLMKPADVRLIGRECKCAMELSSKIHDFYALSYRSREDRVCGMDYRESPKIL